MEKGSMITKEELLDFLELYRNAVVVLRSHDRKIQFANKLAQTLYGVTYDWENISQIFLDSDSGLEEEASLRLKDGESAVFYDIGSRTKDGTYQLVDLQIDYFNGAKDKLLIEIRPKLEQRLEKAIHQVDHATRAEGIFNLDESFSLVYCNELFRKLQHQGAGKKGLLDGICSKMRDKLGEELRETLQRTDHFVTKIKADTQDGEDLWYSMEVQRRNVDESGTDKIMVYLVNIDTQVEMEAELDNVSQYFNTLESLCQGLLYRFDIHTRTLYRSEETAKLYNMPVVSEHFPSQDWLDSVIHPDDVEDFLPFLDSVVEGHENTQTARLKNAKGVLEYHQFTFKPIYNNDGTVKEMVGYAINIHNQKEAEQALDEVNSQFDALQEMSEDLLFRVDIENRILTRRGKKYNRFGLNEENVAFPDAVIDGGAIHPEDIGIYQEFADLAFLGQGGTVEVRMKEQGQDIFRFRRLTWLPVINKAGKVTEIVGKLVDVQAIKELEAQANYDALTNTLNKRAMLEETSQVLARSGKDEKHALFFIDLDNFKYVNDNLGHHFGDQLLKELGSRLRGSIRSRDLVGRVGGDEFVIFMRDVQKIEILLGKAKMLLSTISDEIIYEDLRHSIKGSIGIAVFPEHGNSYEELYHHADMALYQSKHEGKNRVNLYHSQEK